MGADGIAESHQPIINRLRYAPIGPLIWRIGPDVHIERPNKTVGIVPIFNNRQKHIIDSWRGARDISNLLRLVHVSARIKQRGATCHRKRHVDVVAVHHPVERFAEDVAVANQRVRRKMHIAGVCRGGDNAVHIKRRACSQMNALIEQNLASARYIDKGLISGVGIIPDDRACGVGFKDRVGR